MKKLIRSMIIGMFSLSIFTLFTFGTVPIQAAENYNEYEDNQTVKVVTTLKNLETGDVQSEVSFIEAQPIQTRTVGNEETFVAHAESFVCIGENNNLVIKPAASAGDYRNEYGMKTEVNVEYQLNGENIKIIRHYGKWTPNSSIYYMTDRYAWIAEANVFGLGDKYYPTSNTYNRVVNWPYVKKYYDDGAIRAGNTGYVNVVGMTAKQELTILMYV